MSNRRHKDEEEEIQLSEKGMRFIEYIFAKLTAIAGRSLTRLEMSEALGEAVDAYSTENKSLKDSLKSAATYLSNPEEVESFEFEIATQVEELESGPREDAEFMLAYAMAYSKINDPPEILSIEAMSQEIGIPQEMCSSTIRELWEQGIVQVERVNQFLLIVPMNPNTSKLGSNPMVLRDEQAIPI